MELAKNPKAIWLLGCVSFIEAIFFPIPPDVLLIPMILANISKAWLYAIVATLLKYYGEKIKFFIEKYLGWLFLFFIILLVAGTIGLDILWK